LLFYNCIVGKSIKNTVKGLIITAGVLITIPALLFIVLHISDVQTFMVNRISERLSSDRNVNISIGEVDFTFFNKVRIADFLIKDQQNDTMIYAETITAGIRRLNLKTRHFTFGRMSIINPGIYFKNDSSGLLNITWFIDQMRSDSISKDGKKPEISIYQTDIRNGKFLLRTGKREQKRNSSIDFSNLNMSGINGIIESFTISGDTTSFSIYNLGFTESNGFQVNRFVSRMSITKNMIAFSESAIYTDSSTIDIPKYSMKIDSGKTFRNFTDDVRLDIEIENSTINSCDLGLFVAQAGMVNEEISVSGRLSGTIRELRGRNIRLSYATQTMALFDFDISGLPDIDNSYIYLGIGSLTTNSSDIEGIKFPDKKPLVLPDLIVNAGTIRFNGSFTGFTNDFVAYGNLITSAGTLRTDISLRPTKDRTYRVNGLIKGEQLALGMLTGNEDLLGSLSFNTDVDGTAKSFNSFSGRLNGIVDSVEINKYNYRNILLNGTFTEKMWDGAVKINENNIKLDLLGMLSFSKEKSEFDFSLNIENADLHRLNFDKTDPTSNLSLLVTANFSGNNLDNLDGEIKLLNSNMIKYGKALELYNFSIITFSENGKPAINIQTDFGDLSLRGKYNFGGIGEVYNSISAALIPSRFKSLRNKQGFLTGNDFTYKVNLRNTDKINDFFKTGIYISENSSFSGEFHNDSLITLSARAARLNLRNNIFDNLNISARFVEPKLEVSLTSSALSILGLNGLNDFTAGFTARPDTFKFALNWDNHTRILNQGDLSLNGFFSKANSEPGEAILKMVVDSSEMYFRNNPWKVHSASILVDSTSIDIRNIKFSNNLKYYLINGIVSHKKSDTLGIVFNKIDIAPLNEMTSRKSKVESIPLALHGELNGYVNISDIYDNLLIESNLTINGFSLLESNYGDLSINSAWNSEKKVAEIKAGNNLDGFRHLDINGFFDPEKKNISLEAMADKLPVDALNPLLRAFASDIKGVASGRVRLTNSFREPVLTGSLYAENASVKIDYLQTKYTFSDSIRFDRNGFIFNNIRLKDERGNTAVLNGSVKHTYLRDYKPDLTISLRETMALNTRPKDNELFYGTAFATGITSIKDNSSVLTFDISATTNRNTRFYIPLSSNATVSDYSFVTFVTSDSLYLQSKTGLENTVVQQTGFDMNFDLKVTPDAEVQLIFDPVLGDAMKAHGSGDLNIRLDPKGNFRISGDYIIEDGDYLFTLGNILNKPFSVENGGTITFNGDIDNAEIEMKAIYKLKASLYELLQDEKLQERIPVECQINLSGKLFNPIVGFNIYLPQADDATRTLVRNAITTEEELSRQFLYLLVMNSFYADPALGFVNSSTTQTGTSAMAVTTTEMFSNQISNWLSQLSNDFDLGFVYRPGRDINPQEVELALSTQLLNDKVTINGNFDYRGTGKTSTNTEQLTGDFDIEYSLTDRIKLKVFNRFNDPSTGKLNIPYTQGFGIFYRQDFNKFSDLFRRKEKSPMKKEEEIETN